MSDKIRNSSNTRISCWFNTRLAQINVFTPHNTSETVTHLPLHWPLRLTNTSPLPCTVNPVIYCPSSCTVYDYWSDGAPSANLVPMIHSVTRDAGRAYWLTYRSATGAAAALYYRGLINFQTSVSTAAFSCALPQNQWHQKMCFSSQWGHPFWKEMYWWCWWAFLIASCSMIAVDI